MKRPGVIWTNISMQNKVSTFKVKIWKGLQAFDLVCSNTLA